MSHDDVFLIFFLGALAGVLLPAVVELAARLIEDLWDR